MIENGYTEYEDIYEFDGATLYHKYKGPLIYSYRDGNSNVTVKRPFTSYEERKRRAFTMWKNLNKMLDSNPTGERGDVE